MPGLRRHCQSLKMTLLLRKCLQLHIIHLGGSSVSLVSHAGGGSRRAFSSCQRRHYSQQNPYQVLGVKPDADAKTIKAAFITKSKESHPDTNLDDPEGSAKRFQEIVAAYEILNDEDKKSQLDAALRGDRGRQKGGGKKSASDYRDDGIREGHRNIEVDMSLEAMKRRWALYQKHWEKEEGRMQELEELKTAFRIKLDEKRKMFDHLTVEEQAQFKESIRLFRHPKFSQGATEVILTDKEAESRRDQPPPPPAAETIKQQKANPNNNNPPKPQMPPKQSWLFRKILEKIDPTYDSRSDPPPEMVRNHRSANPISGQARKRSFMSQRSPTATKSAMHCSDPTDRKRNYCTLRRSYSTGSSTSDSTHSVPETTGGKANAAMDPYVAEVLAEMAKGKEFDPYEFRDRREGLGDSSYVKEFRKREGSGLDLYDSSYDQNSMVAMQRSVHDHKKELERMEVADRAVRERRAKLQMECYKSQFNPRAQFDDDDPNFVEVKGEKYWIDPLSPLKSTLTKKDPSKMSLKEIAEEKLDNVKGNIERVPRLFQDGGAGETYGTRPRSEYGIKWKYIRILAGLGVTTFTILYLFESGAISFANPADQYVTQTLLSSHSDSDNDKPLAKREQNTRNEV